LGFRDATSEGSKPKRDTVTSKIGYARVSSTGQDLDVQLAALKAAGCDVIRSEKVSGTSTRGRDQLRTILDFIHAGDVLTVTRIDRLARSIGDLQDIVRELKAKGAILKATEQPIDTSSAAGKAFLDMLGVFAEFETNLRRERQMEGISAAKARGVYKGRPPSIDAAKVAALKAEGLGATEIAKRLGVGRASVYRVLAAPSPPEPSSPRRDEWLEAIEGNPRFRLIEPSGAGFILPTKG
jgi:DNA invertase Pin-like site-specific DNA recombinase